MQFSAFRRRFLGSLAFSPLMILFGCAPEVSPDPKPQELPPIKPEDWRCPGCDKAACKTGCVEREIKDDAAETPAKEGAEEKVPKEEIASRISIGTCRLVENDAPAVALALYDAKDQKLVFPLHDRETTEACIAALKKAASVVWPERKA